jgi:hypothetical protein
MIVRSSPPQDLISVGVTLFTIGGTILADAEQKKTQNVTERIDIVPLNVL